MAKSSDNALVETSAPPADLEALGDRLVEIWMGDAGSPAVGADGNTIEGSWEWPRGGYEEALTCARG